MQQYNFPTTVFFGEGSINALAEKLKEQEHRHLLIVTDPTLCELGVINILTDILKDQELNYTVFSDTHANPIENDVDRGMETYKNNNCDSLIALGGGAPMDVAKAIKVLVSHPGPLGKYDEAQGGDRLIRNSMPSLYAIPTTAGTGSEVGRSAVIILKETGRKTVIFHPQLMPQIAVLEPAVTQGLPASITAATGIDALTHCMEAYFAPVYHPMADGIALEGMQLILHNLAIVCKNGNDLKARGKMQLAAAMGATAFQKGLGMVHSLAHPLSAEYNTHHGLCNALLLPPVLGFLEKSKLNTKEKKKLADVQQLFFNAGIEPELLSVAVRHLITSVGITMGLANAGIPATDVEKLSTLAFEDPCHVTNMIPITQQNLLQVYEAAL